MIKNIIRAFALLLLPALWPGTSGAADAGAAPFADEITKQENIYQSRGEKRPEGYVIDRSLLSYTHTLAAGFDRSLADLGPKDRWLDIGAGQGQALLDYFESRFDRMHRDGLERAERKAKAVAISIEDRRLPAWNETAAKLGGDQLQYLAGKPLREYSPGELGRFRLITDVIGGFSYSTNIFDFMTTVLAMLETNGTFYSLLQDVHAENGANKPYYAGSTYLTEIAGADGSEVRICAWLKSISCVEVTCNLKTDWIPPVETYRVRKVCDDVKVPALTANRFLAGTPPERAFKLK